MYIYVSFILNKGGKYFIIFINDDFRLMYGKYKYVLQVCFPFLTCKYLSAPNRRSSESTSRILNLSMLVLK